MYRAFEQATGSGAPQPAESTAGSGAPQPAESTAEYPPVLVPRHLIRPTARLSLSTVVVATCSASMAMATTPAAKRPKIHGWPADTSPPTDVNLNYEWLYHYYEVSDDDAYTDEDTAVVGPLSWQSLDTLQAVSTPNCWRPGEDRIDGDDSPPSQSAARLDRPGFLLAVIAVQSVPR